MAANVCLLIHRNVDSTYTGRIERRLQPEYLGPLRGGEVGVKRLNPVDVELAPDVAGEGGQVHARLRWQTIVIMRRNQHGPEGIGCYSNPSPRLSWIDHTGRFHNAA